MNMPHEVVYVLAIVGVALVFDFINGFHDSANSIATVVSTRVLSPGVAEIKRVYVVPRFRRRGLAQVVVVALEESSVAAGHRSVVLNTGREQPEALALYADLGYRPIEGYGIYACSPGAVFLGKDLGPGARTEGSSWAS